MCNNDLSPCQTRKEVHVSEKHQSAQALHRAPHAAAFLGRHAYAADTSNEYLADLAAAVATTDLPSLHVDYCGRMDLALSSAPESLDAEVDEARDAIKAVHPSAKVGTSAYDDAELLVSLDLTVDDTFAQKSIDTVEALYNAMDFDSTPFDQVTFYLADESGGERARIWFLRCDGVGEPDRVTVSGSIREGRFEEQRQRVIDAAEANTFFQEHMDDLSSWLY